MVKPKFDLGCIPALEDNYIWMLHCMATGQTAVIDPGVSGPVLNAFNNVGWPIHQVLTTHWHPDHVGGVAAIKEATDCSVAGPAAEADRIPGIDRQLREGDRISVGILEAEVWEVPGHTLGHIAYYFKDAELLFIGDTLFAMGCGRLFEGTAEQMFGNMVRLRDLPGKVEVYPAHEYTLSNARFALSQQPDDVALKHRLSEVEDMRSRGERTLPTTMAQEKATNPFLMAPDVAEFARLRSGKDSFR
jgi:hydroxyacylglutathione hydrolase